MSLVGNVYERFERDYSVLYGNSYQMFLIRINFELQLVKFTECESRPCVDFLKKNS